MTDDSQRRWTAEMVAVVEQWRAGVVPHSPQDRARAALMRWPEMYDALKALRDRYEADLAVAGDLPDEVINDDAARLRWAFLSARADQLHRRYWTTFEEDTAHLRAAFPELSEGKARRLIDDATVRGPKDMDPREEKTR